MAMESGDIKYTRRAFRQDADLAMGGDIHRGLIELITNSDDSYVKLGDSFQGAGQILVSVEHRRNRPWEVIVQDRASGMGRQELKKKFN